MNLPPPQRPEDVIHEILHGPRVDLNDIEVARLMQFPVGEVSSLLVENFRASSDRRVRSRAFDALMKITGFDQVGFLIEMLDEFRDVGWRIAFCTALGAFPDPRAIATLCKVLQTDEGADMRFVAAETLGAIGDASAIPALDHARNHDTGVDYEGWPVSGAAERAIGQIRVRLGLNLD